MKKKQKIVLVENSNKFFEQAKGMAGILEEAIYSFHMKFKRK